MKKKILIFGCGYHGRAAYRKCKKKYQIIGWVDNDKKKKNKKLFNLKIYHPNFLKNILFDKIIICGRYYHDQFNQIKNNINFNKILIWGSSDLKPKTIELKLREKEYIKILKNIILKLNKHNIPFWVDRSGLLTLFRGSRISTLSDFDITIEAIHADRLFKIFNSNNIYLVGKIKKKKNNFKKIYFRSRNSILKFEPAIVDIIFIKFLKGRAYHMFNKHKNSNDKYFKKNIVFNYKKLKLKVPLKAKEYLSEVYGKSWKKRPEFWQNKLANKKKKFQIMIK